MLRLRPRGYAAHEQIGDGTEPFAPLVCSPRGRGILPLTNHGLEARATSKGIQAQLPHLKKGSYSSCRDSSPVTGPYSGFIPHWNRTVYGSFVDWLKWFGRGAVHNDDVAEAVVMSIALLSRTRLETPLALPVDGAYEYTDDDLANWDAQGPGSTFRRYYGAYEAMARHYGLVPEEKPFKYDLAETRRWLGYTPRYSLMDALRELERYGPAGPPHPYESG